MKLIDGIKQEGAPFFIPDCHRFELPEFFVELGYKTGVEIGVYKGAFTERLCKAGLRMYAVDPWKSFEGGGRDQERQDRQDFLFGHAGRVLAPYDCVLIRKTSMDALEEFPDESLDFVYIDGNHAFRYVAEDIAEWTTKVRKGGMIAGHDYFNTWPGAKNLVCQVKAVVDAYVSVFEISPWWTFGELDLQKEPDRKERFLSWMWFKR